MKSWPWSLSGDKFAFILLWINLWAENAAFVTVTFFSTYFWSCSNTVKSTTSIFSSSYWSWRDCGKTDFAHVWKISTSVPVKSGRNSSVAKNLLKYIAPFPQLLVANRRNGFWRMLINDYFVGSLMLELFFQWSWILQNSRRTSIGLYCSKLFPTSVSKSFASIKMTVSSSFPNSFCRAEQM